MARAGKGGTRPTYGAKRRTDDDGYVWIYEPYHPLALTNGYVAEHRKVAWDHGLLTDRALQVHHVNEAKDDNRLENLVVLTVSEHAALHQHGKPEGVAARCQRIRAELGDRACEVCGADITALRIDARVCGERCRITRWKRARLASRTGGEDRRG